MRKIIASLFITVDGVVEAPEKWHYPVSIVRQLLDAGLGDELHLLVDPIVYRDASRAMARSQQETGA
jgi:hypothetical protein